jgi:nitrite reductase/ring-hydroxylating ferredoxin subunit/uncharacterized membrane protein
MAETALDRLSEQPWLDPIAEPLTAAVRGAYDSAGDAGRELKNAAHGTWLGHPLHSALTDIPLGAWMTATVLDAAEAQTRDSGYGRAADVAIGFGLAGAAGAAITGLTDWSETDGEAKRLGLLHGLVNVTATTLFATSLFLRRRGSRDTGRGFSMAGLLTVFAGAYLGGRLVYDERIGVDHSEEPQSETFTPVLRSDDLTEGQARKVSLNGIDVCIVRQNGKVFALTERCSHLGGPLSEGTVKEGSVVCPWHGSEFRLTDGAVLNGPSTHTQPCLQVREENGEITLRCPPPRTTGGAPA